MEMVTLVAGSALGSAFQLLFDAVIRAKGNAERFQTRRGNLIMTLETLQPWVEQMEQSGNQLVFLEKSLENFTKTIAEGEKLVEQCCKVGNWSWRNRDYTEKIQALDDSLHRLVSILTLHLASNSAMVRSRIDANNLGQNENQGGVGCTVPPLPLLTVGLNGPLEDLKMKLLRDEKVSMLVLTAPGGCGKTTLAKMFCHDKEVIAKFQHNIIYVNVSNKNEEIAFNWLQKLMEETVENPLLLVLDDVQSQQESLLDKFDEFKRPTCKILVTSRYHFPRVEQYNLEILADEDAKTLFLRSASLPGQSFNIPGDVVEQIVKCCKRSPLAMSVIGRSLCNRSVYIWRKKAKELSEASSILDDIGLLGPLKRCLDDLDTGMTTVKDCFMDLGSFPEDERIPVSALLDMWAELYDLAEDFLSMANLDELTIRSLATLVALRKEEKDADGYYSEHFVTQHDMLRLLAIRESGQLSIEQRERLIIEMSGDDLPKWWPEKNNIQTSARLVSISTDGRFSTKWQNIKMYLPKTEVLVLNFQTMNYALPDFMEKMSKLKVLIATNYGFVTAELSNFKLLGSLSSLKRIRLERIFIPSIITTPISLKSLQKISLFGCTIGQAFSNICMPVSEAFPKLEEISIDNCTDLVALPAGFCDLLHLKMLSITNCHKLSTLPHEIGNLIALGTLRLRSCTNLKEFPGTITHLSKLKHLDIYNCFSIKELPVDIGQMSDLRKINMGQCERLIDLPVSVFDLQHLQQVVCDERTQNLWAPILSSFATISITVVKKEFNLNWLRSSQS